MVRILLLMTLAVSLSSGAFSQSNKWKRLRYEVFGGVGGTNFLGELGGANRTGSDYISDLEISMTRPAFTLGGRYYLDRRVGLVTSFSYGWLRGEDSRTQEIHRNNRNLQFRSPIVEWQWRLEYSILTERKGHRYDLRKVRGLMGNKIVIDAFIGVAGFYFNPRAKDNRPGGTGKYYSLRKVGTEGQNFTETRKPYSRFSFSIPIGFQIRYVINRKWSLIWDIAMRQTFTDYIDDVSKTYVEGSDVAKYNKNKKVSPELAEYFADPSISKNQEGVYNKTAPLQQRGNNKDYDVYMFSFITLNYKLKTTRTGAPRLN